MRAWVRVLCLATTPLLWGADSAAVKIVLPPVGNVPNNGLAKKPPMGWMGSRTSDRAVRETADTMVRNGMKDAGYASVHIGDGWQGKRSDRGDITSNDSFPNMKAVADYVHDKGLKVGIYSSPGPKTCAGLLGSFQHEEQDAKTFAAWEIDYLTYDWCSAGETYSQDSIPAVFSKMGLALLATGRPIIYAVAGALPKVPEWGAFTGANIWPARAAVEADGGPGHWNNPGTLTAGLESQNYEAFRTQFSLWCLRAAPLLVTDDLRKVPAGVLKILTNQEVIAVDQDILGAEGTRVKTLGDLELWVKPLADGGSAVGLFNRGATEATMTIGSSDLGIKTMPKIRDLWRHEDRAEAIDSYSADIPAHGVVLLRVGGN